MATSKQVAERREMLKQLAGQGYSVQLTDWPRRITWYKPDGEAMPNLPADPWHMERYLARGFTPDLPRVAQADQSSVPQGVGDDVEAQNVAGAVQPETASSEPKTLAHTCPQCSREMHGAGCGWGKD